MRIFGSERMDSMLQKLGLQEGEAIVHPWVNKALEKAQQKVEARNFEVRKNLLKFDDVMNDQRKVIYEQRKDLMRADEIHETVVDMRHEVIEDLVTRCIPPNAYAEQWEVDSIHEETLRLFNLDLPVADWAKEEGIADQEIRQRITEASDKKMAARIANFGVEIWHSVEKQVLLTMLDKQWKDHLLSLDHLRHGIALRAYGQRDPLNEYKKEAFELFEAMLAAVRDEVTMMLSRLEVRVNTPEAVQLQREPQEMHETRQDPALVGAGAAPAESAQPAQTRTASANIDPNDPSTWGKVQRNAPCPCGSGKKYKHCHGKL